MKPWQWGLFCTTKMPTRGEHNPPEMAPTDDNKSPRDSPHLVRLGQSMELSMALKVASSSPPMPWSHLLSQLNLVCFEWSYTTKNLPSRIGPECASGPILDGSTPLIRAWRKRRRVSIRSFSPVSCLSLSVANRRVRPYWIEMKAWSNGATIRLLLALRPRIEPCTAIAENEPPLRAAVLFVN